VQCLLYEASLDFRGNAICSLECETRNRKIFDARKYEDAHLFLAKND
jgi:hypothetical protein